MVDEYGSDIVRIFDPQAERLVADYETTDPAAYRATYSSLLPTGSGQLAFDVGAGSGSDAAWFSGLFFDLVAVEPAAGMREAGHQLLAPPTLS